MSRPMPFVIATNGYKLPMAAGEPWVLTQGPYGTFSHWGNALHALRHRAQIQPLRGGHEGRHRLYARSRNEAGPSPAHFRGITSRSTTGDGEYSQLRALGVGAPLLWRTVNGGNRVRHWRSPATAGYTLGEGGGLSTVHVKSGRGCQSRHPAFLSVLRIFPTPARRQHGPHDCLKQRIALLRTAASVTQEAVVARATPGKQFSGQLSVAQWWSELVTVLEGFEIV